MRGIAALAFERIEQRGFFAAFVGARAGVRIQIEIKPRARDVLAEVTFSNRLRRSRRPSYR